MQNHLGHDLLSVPSLGSFRPSLNSWRVRIAHAVWARLPCLRCPSSQPRCFHLLKSRSSKESRIFKDGDVSADLLACLSQHSKGQESAFKARREFLECVSQRNYLFPTWALVESSVIAIRQKFVHYCVTESWKPRRVGALESRE